MVMPTDRLDGLVDCRFRLEGFDLSQYLQAFWLACYQVAVESTPGADRRSQRERGLLDGQLSAAASFANVDGCVVLRRDLQVIGFGGRILVSDDEAERGTPGPDLPLGTHLGGNRHQSALRLCKAVPNSLALVISQDGDLSVFDNAENKVQWSPNLVPDNWL
jgi:DNA integrity scanning protein DisA with diadenylate cyclase activity